MPIPVTITIAEVCSSTFYINNIMELVLHLREVCDKLELHHRISEGQSDFEL